jgi:toxin ParE1/3/4
VTGRLLISNDAGADLDLIADFIACESPTAATRIMRRLIDRFKLLSSTPLSGQVRNDLRPGLRCVTIGNYVIYFEPISDGVRILRVIHGARDIGAAFEVGNPKGGAKD